MNICIDYTTGKSVILALQLPCEKPIEFSLLDWIKVAGIREYILFCAKEALLDEHFVLPTVAFSH